MEHILEHRKKITEQLVKSYSGEESTTGAPKFIVIGHSLAGCTALTTILNALEKSQSEEALSIFVDNNIDESKHQVPSAIDSIVLKGFSVEQLLIIKEDTKGKLEKSYIPELIDLIKADDSVIEEKYKKKIAALKERRDPEGIEKSDEEKKESKEFQGLEDEGVVSDEDEDNVEKSEELTPGEIERQRVANNLQKAYTPIFEDPDYLEKGKKAEIGEIRTWGGVKYVKHQDGWVTFNQKTGKGSVYGSDGKKKMDAGEHHVNHFKEKTDEPGVLGKPDTITLDRDHKREDSKTLVERYREIKNNHDNDPKQISHNDILDSMRRTHAASKNQVEEALVEHGESKIGFTSKTKKPTLEEVDAAFSKVGKALAEGRDPDAISSLRDEAKKLGAAYGMSNEKIDEAISTSKKAHQGEHNQLTEAEKRDQTYSPQEAYDKVEAAGRVALNDHTAADRYSKSTESWEKLSGDGYRTLPKRKQELIQKYLDKLEIHPLPTSSPTDNLPDNLKGGVFIGTSPTGAHFFIDTQGYDYARYVTKLNE